MTAGTASDLVVRLDPANPGQFLACCGLLELSDRFWSDRATGAFADQGRIFRLQVQRLEGADVRKELISHIRLCALANTMTTDQLQRRDVLTAMSKKELAAAGREEEKKELDSLWRECPVTLGAPFNLTIDWPRDDLAGGSTFKTWAGQQSVIDIAIGMRALVADADPAAVNDQILWFSSRGSDLPFNFDSDLGSQGAPLDVGFSFDPLPDMKIAVRPLLEFCAFVGLQRFRPRRIGRSNCYRYAAWSQILPPSVACVAASGMLHSDRGQQFEFRLLYRTKYLKSFLPARPI